MRNADADGHAPLLIIMHCSSFVMVQGVCERERKICLNSASLLVQLKCMPFGRTLCLKVERSAFKAPHVFVCVLAEAALLAVLNRC